MKAPAAPADNWVKLRGKPAAERRVAVVLGIAGGGDRDAPTGLLNALRKLAAAGYAVRDLPADGDALMVRLQAPAAEEFSLADYQISFGALPPATQEKMTARWGAPEEDPTYRPGALDCGRFLIRAVRFGNVLVAAPPARGGAFDPDAPPPHGHLAFCWFLRWGFRADAVVHFGHDTGTLALIAECFPEAALGPLPHLLA